MDSIVVDNTSFDPYFMLDVTPLDTKEHITKSFRKKAKMWHPDKIPQKERTELKIKRHQHHFKVIVECYEYIMGKIDKTAYSKKYQNKAEMQVPINDNLKIKNIDNSSELNNFNLEFDRSRPTNPNDFGYKIDPRISKIEDYDTFEFKPYQLFNEKQYNPDDFNKTFEFQKQQQEQPNSEIGLYYKTTDGFNAFNCGELGGASPVSSFNGVMITGDKFGESGSGYYDTNYSDYKNSFNVPKNPSKKVKIPNDFKGTPRKINPLSKSDMENQMNMRQTNIGPIGSGNKNDFKLQEQELLKKQEQDILNKINNDKNFILQYQHMYSPNIIQDALNNNLITSPDYSNQTNIQRRNFHSNF